jgi:hypothetical protein
VDWRHDDDGEIGFTADSAVRVSIPTADYRQAVHALDRDLMAAMRQRIEELDRRGGPAGVTVDLAELRRDHTTAPGGVPATSTGHPRPTGTPSARAPATSSVTPNKPTPRRSNRRTPRPHAKITGAEPRDARRADSALGCADQALVGPDRSCQALPSWMLTSSGA